MPPASEFTEKLLPSQSPNSPLDYPLYTTWDHGIGGDNTNHHDYGELPDMASLQIEGEGLRDQIVAGQTGKQLLYALRDEPRRTPKTQRYDILKRCFDVVFSFMALVILSPLFLVVATMIKLLDRGPIFFTQKRVGFRGEEFDFYKFRSMVPNADQLKEELKEENQHSDSRSFKMQRDPRITRIGSFLRKTSIDELPQLGNVLIGNMSLVGPRPALPDEVAQYDATALRRLEVRPGLTCFWQVTGRSELPFDSQLLLDLSYAKQRNFMLDLKVLALTFPAVLLARGAY